MCLKNFVLFGMLLMLLVHHRASGLDYGPCTNSLDQPGECRNIKMCEPLLNLLRAYGNNARDFLKRSVCNVNHADPIVCCPFTEIHNNASNDYDNGNSESRIQSNSQYGKGRLQEYGPLMPPTCGFTDATFPRVVNGVPATLGMWPWAALLGYRSRDNSHEPRFLCGGSLISSRHVLTAGHCVYKRKDLYLVRLGELDISDENDGAKPINLPIERLTVHPRYDPIIFTNDIAVLRLSQDVHFTDLIKPICLPVTKDIQQKDLTTAQPFIIGWGAVYWNGPTSSKLLQFESPLVNVSRCKVAYKDKGAAIDDNVLCAGHAQGGTDACQGDSGGPMMLPIGKSWYSIGVVSYGFRCALPGFPGVYTKTQSFLDFILPLLK